jgi:MbtH protein
VNPFDDENAQFKVLVNDEGQYSVWPAFAEVPAGWTVCLTDSPRSECLAYVEANWVDMRPRSLVEAMRAGDAR